VIDISVELLLETSSIGLKEMRNSVSDSSPAFAVERVNRILELWVESQAKQMVIDWFIQNGEKLVAAIEAKPQEVIEVQTHETNATNSEAKPTVTATQHQYEFWRSEQRHARKRRA